MTGWFCALQSLGSDDEYKPPAGGASGKEAKPSPPSVIRHAVVRLLPRLASAACSERGLHLSLNSPVVAVMLWQERKSGAGAHEDSRAASAPARSSAAAPAPAAPPAVAAAGVAAAAPPAVPPVAAPAPPGGAERSLQDDPAALQALLLRLGFKPSGDGYLALDWRQLDLTQLSPELVPGPGPFDATPWFSTPHRDRHNRPSVTPFSVPISNATLAVCIDILWSHYFRARKEADKQQQLARRRWSVGKRADKAAQHAASDQRLAELQRLREGGAGAGSGRGERASSDASDASMPDIGGSEGSGELEAVAAEMMDFDPSEFL